jgi:transposase
MNSHPETIPIERYIAIDLHKHYVMVGGQNAQQEWVLRPRKVQMSRFRDWAAKNLKPGDAVVIEATGNTWDIYDIVAPLVTKTLVAHAGKVRQIAEARVKTDKADVKRLILLLIAGIVPDEAGEAFPEVWVPPMHVRELRSLVSFRWRLGKQITMSKNRLHGIPRPFGDSVIQSFNLNPPEGKILADKHQSWWEQQEFSELTGFQVQLDLQIVEQLEAQKALIDQKLAELSNMAPWASEMVYLMQIPGFGIIFSMIALSASGDVSRFSHPKKLVGYAGLGAGVHDSGEKHQDKSITKTGRKELRWAMVEVAWGAVRSDPYWKAQYERLTKIKHPNKAIVAIARRLLVAVWHILTKHDLYRHFDDEAIAYKMLTWSQRMDEKALNGMSRQQFAKYGLLRLGIGQDITRIVRNGLPRRLAPAAEVLALKPELKLLE